MKLLAVLSLFVIGTIAQFDYCKVCPDHVACLNKKGAWAATCPKDAALADLNNELTDLFVSEHNNYRNQLATGKVAGFKSATNMMKLKWNSEMSSIASYNVKQCEMMHDACRNTQDGKSSGQNLYASKYSGSGKPDFKSEIKSAVALWFNEYKSAKQSDVDQFVTTGNWKDFGHFTQLEWAVNTQVGCAISSFSGKPWNKVFIACNYGPGNIKLQPVYISGTTASKCKSKDNVFTGLCTA